MSLKHAILGFLSFSPLSGYDLKKAFDRSVQHFWPANQSQIYRTLAELAEEGNVVKEVVEREERLDLKIYTITPAGRATLHQWLATPLPEPDDREPFLIQVFFGSILSDDEVVSVLRHKLQTIEERLAVYQMVLEVNQNPSTKIHDPRALFLNLITLEVGYRTNQSIAQWLRDSIERVQSKNYSIHLLEKHEQEF
jgi:PadR family transcriptional regulator AphA